MSYTRYMWPFRRLCCLRERHGHLRRLVLGVIIGSAIASIVGRKIAEHHRKDSEGQKKS